MIKKKENKTRKAIRIPVRNWWNHPTFEKNIE